MAEITQEQAQRLLQAAKRIIPFWVQQKPVTPTVRLDLFDAINDIEKPGESPKGKA